MLSGVSSAVDYEKFEYRAPNYTPTPSGSVLNGVSPGSMSDDLILNSAEAGMRILDSMVDSFCEKNYLAKFNESSYRLLSGDRVVQVTGYDIPGVGILGIAKHPYKEKFCGVIQCPHQAWYELVGIDMLIREATDRMIEYTKRRELAYERANRKAMQAK